MFIADDPDDDLFVMDFAELHLISTRGGSRAELHSRSCGARSPPDDSPRSESDKRLSELGMP